MNSSWIDNKLGDFVTFKTGKLNSNAAVANGEYPFFTCAQEIYRTNSWTFDTECVLLGGNNANAVFPMFYYKGKFDAYQRTYVIETKEENNIKFFYYALRKKLEDFRQQSTGVTTKFLTLPILNNLKISVPDHFTQEKISSLISSYDDLIENNGKRIKILEEMAQRLYTEWFVKFKFPDHENLKLIDSDTEFGVIPEEWEIKNLRDVCDYVSRGISPKYDDVANSLVINQKCIRNHKLNLKEARHQSKAISSHKQIKFGDVLINSTGIGTLGRIAQVYKEYKNCTVDSHVSIVRPSPLINVEYFGITLINLEDYFTRMGTGATGQTELSRDTIQNTRILVPPVKLQVDYSKNVSTLRKLTINLIEANENLKIIRDLLIPQLVTGKRVLQ